jgi:hypothetical protein
VRAAITCKKSANLRQAASDVLAASYVRSSSPSDGDEMGFPADAEMSRQHDE